MAKIVESFDTNNNSYLHTYMQGLSQDRHARHFDV